MKRDECQSEGQVCQAKLYMTKGEERELIAQDVIYLEETPEGVRYATFFEEPKLVPGRVASVDLLKHAVLLSPLEG
jgi:predicted RNA-binding protein